MCFSAPKPPKPPPPDPDLAAQKEAARAAAARAAAKDKQGNLNQSLSMLGGDFGIRSLLSGSAAGRGYGSSLLL